MDNHLSKQARDLADYNAELAGVENGKIDRFFTGEASLRGPDGRRKREEKERKDFLSRLLLDQIYRQAWEDAWAALERAQSAVDQRLLETTDAIDRLEALLTDLENNAVRLEDGTRVFASADGGVYTADGRRLSDAQSASLHMPSAAPSWEQYRDARDALHSARARRDRLANIQTDVLDTARDRLQDDANPPTIDELKQIEADILAIEGELAPPSAKQTFGAHSNPAPTPVAQARTLDLGAPNPNPLG